MASRTGFVPSLFLLALCLGFIENIRYEPTWESLESRPLPKWFDEAKFGIFIHWGVYSVPSFSTEWFWSQLMNGDPAVVKFMQQNYRDDFTYGDFAPQFTAEFFNADEWVELFQDSGAKYIVFTTKHHDGFTMWPSNVSWNWNSGDVGPGRDIVGELTTALRNKTDLKLGLYHSLFEWYNPLWLQDQANNFTTNNFVTRKTMPELYHLVKTYLPDMIHSDGDWEATDTYWQSKEFFAWMYNDSPVKENVVINDAWGINCTCRHGGFFNCQDKFNPHTLQPFKWECQTSIDPISWGFRRNMKIKELMTTDQIISNMVEVISCGGNYLLNIGPEPDGMISAVFKERLLDLGTWLGVNGEAIYTSHPWVYQNDSITPNVWYTSRDGPTGQIVYAIVLDWPEGATLTLGSPDPEVGTEVSMIGYEGEFTWHRNGMDGMDIDIPAIPANRMPCDWGWVFKITGLIN
ncbi:tissue alpha-L-fucosidase-like [Haliotis cracherodii]|uniref:tissue alpha-L-fucosidase-like n=1 Tax=Haliotis cracherodii TaxID=6455 RepID=UPI0039E9F21C